MGEWSIVMTNLTMSSFSLFVCKQISRTKHPKSSRNLLACSAHYHVQLPSKKGAQAALIQATQATNDSAAKKCYTTIANYQRYIYFAWWQFATCGRNRILARIRLASSAGMAPTLVAFQTWNPVAILSYFGTMTCLNGSRLSQSSMPHSKILVLHFTSQLTNWKEWWVYALCLDTTYYREEDCTGALRVIYAMSRLPTRWVVIISMKSCQNCTVLITTLFLNQTALAKSDHWSSIWMTNIWSTGLCHKNQYRWEHDTPIMGIMAASNISMQASQIRFKNLEYECIHWWLLHPTGTLAGCWVRHKNCSDWSWWICCGWLDFYLPPDLHFQIHTDNFFSSLSLGTPEQSARTEHRSAQSCQTWRSQKNRGEVDFRQDTANSLLLTKWHDNAVVSVVSNCHGIKPLSSVARWSGKQRKQLTVTVPSCAPV